MNFKILDHQYILLFMTIILARYTPLFAQSEPKKIASLTEKLPLKERSSNLKLQEVKLQFNYCFLASKPKALETRNLFQGSSDKNFGANTPAFDLQFLFGTAEEYDEKIYNLLFGIGIGSTQYNFDNQVRFSKKNNQLVYEIDTIGTGYIQNRISHRYIEIPVTFSVQLTNMIYWDNSVTAGWNFNSIYKNKHYNKGILTTDRQAISDYTNDLRISLQTGICIARIFSLHFNWEPTPQFSPDKSTLKTQHFKLGMGLHLPIGSLH